MKRRFGFGLATLSFLIAAILLFFFESIYLNVSSNADPDAAGRALLLGFLLCVFSFLCYVIWFLTCRHYKIRMKSAKRIAGLIRPFRIISIAVWVIFTGLALFTCIGMNNMANGFVDFVLNLYNLGAAYEGATSIPILLFGGIFTNLALFFGQMFCEPK